MYSCSVSLKRFRTVGTTLEEFEFFSYKLCGQFQILEVIFALFLDKKNISSYLGPPADISVKIVQISSTYVLVQQK